MASNSLLNSLQSYLHLTAEREQLVTSNMANVDTPGYRTKDFNFDAAMQEVMDGNASVEPPVRNVSGLPERPDGNDVSVDRESLLLSQMQLQYQLGEQLVKDQFQNILSAIKDEN